MPNILIRDLSQEAVDRIDAAAANLGLSRNEYLRPDSRRTPAPPVSGWSPPRIGSDLRKFSLIWPTPR